MNSLSRYDKTMPKRSSRSLGTTRVGVLLRTRTQQKYCYNPCQLPNTYLDHFSTLARVTGTNPAYITHAHSQLRIPQTSQLICGSPNLLHMFLGPMVRCGLPTMEFQSLVDHHVARATLQQPEPYQATKPPSWANVRKSCAFRPHVGSTSHPASPI